METAASPAVAPMSARHEAICDAAFQMLSEVGYDQMSMDAIAARARASKATIYRFWQHKPDLVIDALAFRFGGTPEPPDTGTLRGDLIALVTLACQLAKSPDGAVVVGLMSAAARHPELSRALYECAYRTKQGVHETLIDRAAARGELPAGTDPGLLHEVLHAMVLTRRMWAAGPLDEDFAVHVVDNVLLPVLHHERAADG
jgi:AcrR family transcriptional regulator